jgi:hypothetical protein
MTLLQFIAYKPYVRTIESVLLRGIVSSPFQDAPESCLSKIPKCKDSN